MTPAPSARTRRRLGQHFLADPGAVRRLIEAVAPQPGERFFEVGPGRGALTAPLLEAGVKVLALEIDPRLVRRLESVTASENLRIVAGDVLRVDLAALFDQELPPGRGLRAVGNLPYSVASPVILRLLALSERFEDLTLMVQREVGERILSPPGKREYGILTLLCGCRAEAVRLLDLPPGCFSPPPEVHSTVLRFKPRLSPFASSADGAIFERVVKAAFSARRKKIRNSLSGGSGLPPEKVEEWLEAAGLDPAARPEDVPLQGYLELARRRPQMP
ncbi:MAG TPA: 16S rRNA (adenine(1518)-N(6)/adenine(1519)-N(6))-dimethyltransferase RsmA [Candidatus Polarisedimenticolia bacterium]|nr:16S rRNA (adenine(1518)-N(6)/adenine(1519)-N(6))-dimethyltransferase RsmA [Candidatus Polarisedimenticolia bacterium]